MNYRICILILAGLVLAGFARGKEDWNANGAHFGRQRKAVSSRRLFRAKNWLRDDVVQQQEVSHQRQTLEAAYQPVGFRAQALAPGTYVTRVEPPGYRPNPMQAYVPILDEKYASNHQFETVPYPVYYSPAAHPHMPGTNLSNLGPSEQQQQRRPVLLISNVPPQLWRSEQPVQAAVNYYAPQGYFPRTSQQFPPTAVHDYTSPQFPITVTSSAPTTTSPLSDLESATAYPSSSESESSEERENENNNETKGYSTESPSSSSSTNFSTQIPQYIQQYPAQAINSAIDFGTTYSQAPMAPVQLPASPSTQPQPPPLKAFVTPSPSPPPLVAINNGRIPYRPEPTVQFLLKTPNYIPGKPYQPPGGPRSPQRPPLPPAAEPPRYSVYSPPVNHHENEQLPPNAYSPPPNPRTAPTPPSTSTTEPTNRFVPNRPKGQGRIVCEQTGVKFSVDTIFPFTGQIFAQEKKRTAGCHFSFKNAESINATFSFVSCGIPKEITANQKSVALEKYYIQLIVLFEQLDHTTTMQSFVAQCFQQNNGGKGETTSRRRIDDALAELKLTPIELDQKAPIPAMKMRILTNIEHNKAGDGVEISETSIGQSLRIEFSLQPESDAYGFIVRNCFLSDATDGARHLIIDQNGCSTDLSLFSHPQYDVGHDVARVYWSAFKLPDHDSLYVRCRFELCTDIPDDRGYSNCALFPTPPFCPDIVTSLPETLLQTTAENGSTTAIRHKRDQWKNIQLHRELLESSAGRSFDLIVRSQIFIQKSDGIKSKENAPSDYFAVNASMSKGSGICVPHTSLLIGLCLSSSVLALSSFIYFIQIFIRHRRPI